MHRTSLLTILSLVPLTLSTAIPSDGWELDKRQRPVRPCSHLTGGVHVIAAGGDGVQNTGQYGLIGSLATRILQAIPGSTNVTLPYDKSRNGAQVPKIDQGASNLNSYISQYRQYCPNTKIVLLGYSSGAIITMNTLCGAYPPFNRPPGPIGSGPNPGLPQKIIANVVYGDQTRTQGPGYNLGSCGQQYAGRFPRYNDDRCVRNFQYQSYCDLGDPECCVGSPGQNPQIHFGYPGKYDGAATNFVVNRFQATGGA